MCNFIIYNNNLNLIKKYTNIIFSNFNNIHLTGIISNKKELEFSLKAQKINLIIISYADSQKTSILPLINNIENKIIICDEDISDFKDSKHTLYLSSQSSLESTLKKLKLFTPKVDEEFIRKRVRKILEKFNFDFKLIGTKYLLEAIVYSYLTKETYLFENLEKQIYPYVSQKYKVAPQNIKWAIIRSINNMKTRLNASDLQNFSLEDSEKITSKFIISEIVNRL